jgi:hypothetical protein
MLRERPDNFVLKHDHALAKGLVFAGLGGGRGSLRYTDSSLHKNTGTLTAMDPPSDWVWVPELGRWGAFIDENTPHVDTSIVGQDLIPNALTLACWVKSSRNTNAILSRFAGSVFEYRMAITSGGRIEFVGNISGSTRTRDNGAAVWSFGSMHHVAVVLFNFVFMSQLYTAQSYYFNGQFVGATNIQGSLSTVAGASSRIGNAGVWCSATFSDPLIYNRALSLTEIPQLADPSNVMLSGLIQPPRRKYYGFLPITTYIRKKFKIGKLLLTN